jgi:hypothetical protein
MTPRRVRILAAVLSLGFALAPVVMLYVLHANAGRLWALFYFAAWLSEIAGRWLAATSERR